VLAFIFLYFMTIAVLTFALLISGLDLLSSLSAIVACINNAGPGLNLVGPSTNYGTLNDFQSWVCIAGMFLGRVEIITFACCSRRRSGANKSTAMLALQFLDGLLLLLEHRAHQIADREHTDHPLAIDHRQVSKALFAHEAHAVAHGLVGLTVVTGEVMI